MLPLPLQTRTIPGKDCVFDCAGFIFKFCCFFFINGLNVYTASLPYTVGRVKTERGVAVDDVWWIQSKAFCKRPFSLLSTCAGSSWTFTQPELSGSSLCKARVLRRPGALSPLVPSFALFSPFLGENNLVGRATSGG